MRKVPTYLCEGKLVIRHGQQFFHLHQALKQHDEAAYIGALAQEYRAAGRVQTLAEGIVLAGATITAYRSNEAGERAAQRARSHLDEELTKKKAAADSCNFKGA